jgi:AcrR family transcriptional regulator
VATPRPRGRYAEAARNDRRILDAAREVFTREGFDAPVAAVAARAGVGIGSLYRRYGTKEELLQRLCVLAMEQSIAAAEQAAAMPDPWAALTAYVRACVGFGAGVFAPAADLIATTPEMWSTARRSRGLADSIVARAHTAGVLRADATALDIAVLIGWLGRYAPASDDPEEPNARDRLLALALAGLRPGSPEPLPGHPPPASWYYARWGRPPG